MNNDDERELSDDFRFNSEISEEQRQRLLDLSMEGATQREGDRNLYGFVHPPLDKTFLNNVPKADFSKGFEVISFKLER